MAETPGAVRDVPPAPDAPMPLRARLRALRTYHTGTGEVRAAGGPVAMLRFGPGWLIPPIAVVTSPAGARDVLGGADSPFDKQGQIHREVRILGDNLFSMPHETWLPRRRALQPLFTRKHVAGFAGHMAGAADTLSQELIEAGTVDLDAQCRRLTLRVVGRSLFGRDLGRRAQELGPAVRTSLEWVSGRAMRPVRAPGWLPTPARRRLRTSRAFVRGVIDESIDAARADPSSDAQLIHRLLTTIDPATGQPLSQQAIREELVAFLVAGHDTTATTLAYSLWALGHDRALQDRVAAEVTALGSRALTVDDVPRLPLTVRVIHEALRLCPPASVVTRTAVRDAVVDGYRVPAGTEVLVGVYTLHRDPTAWTDPDTFDPDRFLPERSVGRNRWQYLPFGGGPRTCIGDHFAMLEAALGLASVIRAAEIRSLRADFPIALPFTLTAGAPVPAAVAPRRGPADPTGTASSDEAIVSSADRAE